MSRLSDKQLTDKAKAFFKANEDVDSVYMTDDGNVFLKKNRSFAQGHSHGTDSGEVYEFFRQKVFAKKSGSSEEVDNTQESKDEQAKKEAEAKAKADQEAKEKEAEKGEGKGGDNGKLDKASELPEKYQKLLNNMSEDELIDLAVYLGSPHSQPTIRKQSIDEIKTHIEDLASKKKVELIK